MAIIADIAQAVVDELNASPLAQGFTAARHYRPVFDLPELKTVRVSVVPKGITIAGLARNQDQRDVAIDVAVQKKVATADAAELDGLMGLVEEIAGFFRLRRLVRYPDAMWVKTENSPIYSPEHLESKGVFTSALTLTFRVMK